MKRTWSVGLLAGLISGVVSIGLYYLLIAVTGFHFKQLNPVSILIASVVSNLVGAFIYVKLREKTARPRLHYTWIAIGFALLLTLMDWAYPPEPHIGDISAPIHAIVVSISIILIPNRLRRSNR
ncbi:DUF6069 family protein [Cohnella nanjingensis]|uniref:DUF1440 domain-containing protein n=1 Tax=Cohnella nanjingensis TaxID=1387779 RepID=A0A7X0RQN6_9BACL|nr:DUF6069 family protein [Cohnella nanjingensis]MBB6671924.1 hypothetical protein [Cohnella nanjingensis]